jgi:hypothetical protein
MSVSIKKFNHKRKEDIQDAANLEWKFEDWYEFKGSGKSQVELAANGQSCLCGGESEEEFAHRLAKAVMEANGGPCEVEVSATYLEDLPNETYTFGKEDYKQLVGKGKKK